MESLNLTVYYDGECGFCRRWLWRLRRWLRVEHVLMVPAQQIPEVLSEMRRVNSWIAVEPSGKRVYQFEAFIKLCEVSPRAQFLALFLRFKPVFFVGTLFYKFVARNRRPISKVI
ncbi:MAG: DUF393 domain-containing protein [Candidatus Omnitrophica bacterium]|nr:DUF393 domain-containing protein [Candidatus Omnitrophota bacterium]